MILPSTVLVDLLNLILTLLGIAPVCLRSTNQASARCRVTASPKISLPRGFVPLDYVVHCHAQKYTGNGLETKC
jgi:hypothetical protein